jgi:hypothetical protein
MPSSSSSAGKGLKYERQDEEAEDAWHQVSADAWK